MCGCVFVYVCMYSRAYVSMINKTKKGQLPPTTSLGKHNKEVMW